MMLASPRDAPLVCARCVFRQVQQHVRRHQSTTASPLPPSPPSSGAAQLTTRRLISLHGAETPKFLQGILTNNVRADASAGFFAAFLTAQGKVLHDTFVYPTIGSDWHKLHGTAETDAGYLVEIDAEQADMLFKHLKRHKLRSKFTLRLVEEDELEVWSVWKERERWTTHTSASGPRDGGVIGLTDARAPGMGHRLILLGGHKRDEVLKGVEPSTLEAYTIRRYLRGVPEGQKEMPRDEVLPMNCNLDIMGGIDFKKGCYLGQELTIRTHHTGVVRRRILPIMLGEAGSEVAENLQYNPNAGINAAELAGMDIRKDGTRKRSTGKVIAGIGNIGLGMCRLEQMTDLQVTAEASSYLPEDKFLADAPNGRVLGIRAFVPDWVRGNIREPRQQKRVE